LASRIPPESPEGTSEWSTALGRRVLHYAILKYGSSDSTEALYADEFKRNSEGFLVPRDLTYEDVLDVSKAEYLSFEYDAVTSSLRRVWKGGVLLPLDSEHGYDVENTDTQEKLIQHIDRRKWTYSSFLSGFGSVVDIDGLRSPQDGLGSFIVPELNVRRLEWRHDYLSGHPAIAPPQFPYKPNYLLLPFQIDGISDLLSLFGDEIEQRFGVTRDELIAFLWSLDTREFLLMTEDPRRQYTMMQRGYMAIPPETKVSLVDEVSVGLRGAMELKYKKTISAGAAQEATRRVLDCLTYSDEQLGRISLWDASPARVFTPVFDGMLICDYSQIPEVLGDFFADLSSLSGASGNIKGDNFEREVERVVRGASGLASWEFRKNLKTMDGVVRNLDASFTVDSTLWIVECKAMGEPHRLARGEARSLDSRWRTLEGYCGQAKSLAELVERNPVGRNYAVPAHVTRFEWAVCTPGAEYTPTLSREYWISGDIPRVCTPRELLAVVLRQ